MDTTWERALGRYADRIYRLALLRDPDPERAAQATAAAFRAQDWTTTELDDTIEGKLLAALAPLGRIWRKDMVPGIRAAYWRLQPQTRLALALRLTRGYTPAAIAAALVRSEDEVRRMLVDAIATLAGDSARELRDECRRSRMARLDEHGAERTHVLTCADCQAAAPRWEQAEESLGEELVRVTAPLSLPRPALEELRAGLRGGATHTAPIWRQPALLQGLLIVCVIVAVLALVIPRQSTPTGARAPLTARDLLGQAVARYGSVPDGTGVLHRRYAIEAEAPRTLLTAETWVNPRQPAQHRMQLNSGQRIQEWQAGDGDQRFRYFLMNDALCRPGYSREALALGALHVWKMDGAAQAAIEAARWRLGAWALGRHYLEAALDADQLRSLGTVSVEENGTSVAVVTLAAEGRAIDGTLLLRLDAATGELREVREVVDDNGVAHSRTPWRLLDEEWLSLTDAKRAGIFTTPPLTNRPRELLRTAPLLDPGCPALDDQALISLPQRLADAPSGPSFFWLSPTPPDTTQMVAASEPLRSGANRARSLPGWTAMTYIAPGKRLVLRGTLGFSVGADDDVEQAGEWRVHFTASGQQRLNGVAVRTVTETQQQGGTQEPFEFFSEGWTRDELVQALASARPLLLGDAVGAGLPVYDPVTLPPAVKAIIEPALRAIERPAGQILHGVFDYQMREQPAREGLGDPYHATSTNGTSEFWAAYDGEGQRERYRTILFSTPKQIRWVDWNVAGDRRLYYPGLGVVAAVPDEAADQMERIEQSVRDVLRYGLFDVADSPPGTITLRGAVPIAATDLLDARRSQSQSRWASLIWPWVVDLDFDFVTYRRTFDQRTGQLVSAETWADVGGQLTLLERLDVERLETLASAGDSLDQVLPSSTPLLDINFSAPESRSTRYISQLEDAIAASPTQLWGWRDPAQADFASATLSTDDGESRFWFEQIDDVLDTNAAARLRYRLPYGEEIALLEGQTAYIRLSLLQTPPEWTSSRRAQIFIGGVARDLWLMRDEGDRRWAIVEVGETTIVISYTSAFADTEISRLLEQMEWLR